MSLSRHLTSPSATHGRLAFHPECPRCRNERLNGQLAGDRLVALRTQAALAAGLLAFSAGAPPAAALASSQIEEQEGGTDPGVEAPGLEAEFDPGADHGFDADISTPPSAEGGGQEDEGDGPPVETEPLSDPDVDQVDSDAPPLPEPPPALQDPELALPPSVPPATPPATPAPTPAEPPVAAPPQAPEPPAATTKPSTSDGHKEPKPAERRKRQRQGPASEPVSTPDAPPAANPAPVTIRDEPAAVSPTLDTAAVSQPADAAGDSFRGAGYRVREGDSLWSIAARRLGPEASAGQIARQVNRLWELNADRIGTGNPSLIHVGTMLRLR
jgi:resuscitation-promoting factor RpfA